MAYCTYCGREAKDHCICLKDNPVPKWHAWIIYILIITVPVYVLTTVKQDQSIWNIDYLMVGGILLSSILLFVSILQTIMKRPYLALLFGCHQIRSRSLSLFGRLLPICARCSGIYVGVIAISIIQVVIDIPIFLYPLLAIPLIIDGYIQHKQIRSSTNIRRFITGFMFGATFIFLFTIYHSFIVYIVEVSIDKFFN